MTGTNDVPVAVADVAAATEDGAVVTGSVATNDSDVDASDVLTYALNAPVAGLTLNADGSYSFDPSDAAYQFLAVGETLDVVANYTVSDGNGGTATSTLTITVTGTNDVPVISSLAIADINENEPAGAVVYQAVASDTDTSDVLTYSLAGADAADFTIDPVTGTVTQNASLDFEARSSYNFTVIATDPAGASDSVDVTLTVNNQLDPANLDIDGDADITTVEQFDASGANFLFSDSAGVASNAEIVNFDGDDFIQVDAPTTEYSFSTANDGSNALRDDLIITINNAGVVSQIVVQDAIAAGTFINSEQSAETAVGYNFFQSTAPLPPVVTTSLDADSDNDLNSVEQFSGAGAQVTFTDSALTGSNAEIVNFGADDQIDASGDAADYTFSSSNDGSSLLDDIIITINNAGVISQIVVQDVADSGVFVFDEASAEAAVGFDFFEAGVGAPPPPPPPPPVNVSADQDNDGNVGTTFVLDAAGGAFVFEDNALVANNIIIQNFGNDDVFNILNANPADYSFTSEGDDLIITFSGPNGVNQVRLEGAADPGVFVFDESTAEEAVGNVLNGGVPLDFFQP